MGRYTRTWQFVWEKPYMDEILSFQKDRSVAEEVAIECENFLGIPVMVTQTRWDKFRRRYRVVCRRQHLEDGFVWEREP